MSPLEKRKLLRVEVQQPLRVYVRSIGSNVEYEFKSDNLSPQGINLIGRQSISYPFNSSTLLDVWVQIKDKQNSVIYFTAKIIRTHKKQGKLIFGLRIVQISNESELKLIQYITDHHTQNFSSSPKQKSGFLA